MVRIPPEQWRPIGVKALEGAAEDAVRSDQNTLVVAGPGAGKTELLAQRACYLLQTGLCERPRRILAISFKRDAARNLANRVALRCGADLSQRFDSFTFDAFSKGLVDRFGRALPQAWRPDEDYLINFGLKWRPPAPIADENAMATKTWASGLHENKPSQMNFPMIGRLAEHILRVNPSILKALRQTYAYVFLDEFQDTTGIHYQMVRTAFLGSSAILTAVGDQKQRIMKFAGARDGIFGEFRENFQATVSKPALNHRAAPELVRVLRYLNAALETDAVEPQAVDDGSTGQGECRLFVYADHIREAEDLSALIQQWVTVDGVEPRQICVLTRNRPAEYTAALQSALKHRDIGARTEVELQDLLSEPLAELLVNLLRLGSSRRAPTAWADVTDLLGRIRGGDTDESRRVIEVELTAFLRELRQHMKAIALTRNSIETTVQEVLSFVGRDAFTSVHRQYAQGDFYDQTVRQFVSHLSQYLDGNNWSLALDGLEGVGAVPVMTVHKSKGLEYHTIVFVGLEDSAFWGFKKERREDTCNFFVAFSRAQKRVIFTFCENRESKPGQGSLAQVHAEIEPLFKLLKLAGIEPEAR